MLWNHLQLTTAESDRGISSWRCSLIVAESDDVGSQVSTDWNRRHETDRADERANNLDGNDLPSRNRADCLARLAKEQEERERGAGVREEERVDCGGDVILPDPDAALVQLVDTCVRRGTLEFDYGRYLRDSDIIEHAE